MRNIWGIFKRDVKRLWKNWVAMIVVAGVCIIPSLYAWFNIAANYDPYSNTQGIQIAVANEDQGMTRHCYILFLCFTHLLLLFFMHYAHFLSLSLTKLVIISFVTD